MPPDPLARLTPGIHHSLAALDQDVIPHTWDVIVDSYPTL